ncbi:MAG: HigA family addiction module antitoxin [Persicimonas sp.]
MITTTEQHRHIYEPDTVSPPGETLKETLDALGMTQRELAKRTGRHQKTISEIINAKATITAETALQFEHVLGIPASFWTKREQRYQEFKEREKEREELAGWTHILKDFPVKAMAELGFVERVRDKVEQLRELLRFFGVATPAQLLEQTSSPQAAFRKSTAFEASDEAVSAWLRAGEKAGREMNCEPFDASEFRQALDDIRAATAGPIDEFFETAVERASRAGVAVVLVPQLSDSRVCGATRWLAPQKALIQLSLRYKTDDHFFFTLFHEAGHVLLHGKSEAFLEVGNDEATTDEKEEEADKFSRDYLIPPADYARFLQQTNLRYVSHSDIQAFAREIGVAPGVVVGRLQHDEHVPYRNFNKLKQRLPWAEAVE